MSIYEWINERVNKRWVGKKITGYYNASTQDTTRSKFPVEKRYAPKVLPLIKKVFAKRPTRPKVIDSGVLARADLFSSERFPRDRDKPHFCRTIINCPTRYCVLAGLKASNSSCHFLLQMTDSFCLFVWWHGIYWKKPWQGKVPILIPSKEPSHI